jgi:hypothetical protein
MMLLFVSFDRKFSKDRFGRILHPDRALDNRFLVPPKALRAWRNAGIVVEPSPMFKDQNVSNRKVHDL